VNYLIIVLDSARYDTFVTAETPNFDSLGRVIPCHSPSASTVYSVWSYLYNYGPTRTWSEVANGLRTFRTETLRLVPLDLWTWISSRLQSKGYRTVLLTGNPLIYYKVRKAYNHGWDLFLGVKYRESDCAREIFEDIAGLLSDQPYFIFTLIMDTHLPYYDGERYYGSVPAPYTRYTYGELFHGQVRSIEYVDHLFGDILLPDLSDVQVVVTSDHGDFMSEPGDFYGESLPYIGHGNPVLSPVVFRIPFIRGYVP